MTSLFQSVKDSVKGKTPVGTREDDFLDDEFLDDLPMDDYEDLEPSVAPVGGNKNKSNPNVLNAMNRPNQPLKSLIPPGPLSPIQSKVIEEFDDEDEVEQDFDEMDSFISSGIEKNRSGQAKRVDIAPAQERARPPKSNIELRNEQILDAELECSEQCDEHYRANVISDIRNRLIICPELTQNLPKNWDECPMGQLLLLQELIKKDASSSITREFICKAYYGAAGTVELVSKVTGYIDLTGYEKALRDDSLVTRALMLASQDIIEKYGYITDNPWLLLALATSTTAVSVYNTNVKTKQLLNAVAPIPDRLLDAKGNVKLPIPPSSMKLVEIPNQQSQKLPSLPSIPKTTSEQQKEAKKEQEGKTSESFEKMTSFFGI